MAINEYHDHDTEKASFRDLLRVLFVLFSLFLTGDIFYRWDGFSYYAPLSEFIPAAALAFIIWSLISIFTTCILWLIIKLLHYSLSTLGFRTRFNSLLLYLLFFTLAGAAAWEVKKAAFPSLQTTFMIKLVVLLFVSLAALLLARITADRAGLILKQTRERITPLVWLFGALFFLSIPTVSYHTWIKDRDIPGPEVQADVSRPDTDRPNILLVTFDAMTARDMSLYGYHLDTTPFMSRWAKTASLFTNVKAESTITTPTTASLMTGKRLWSHMTFHQTSAVQKNLSENIVNELRKNGYYTMAYIENSKASPESLGIAGYFNKMIFMPLERGLLYDLHTALSRQFHGRIRLYDWIFLEDFYPALLFREYIYGPVILPLYTKAFPGQKYAFSRGDTPMDRFISDISSEAPQEPFFAWVHMLPPHSTYVPPPSFQGRFDASQRLRKDAEQLEALKRIKKRISEGSVVTAEDEEDIRTLRARYNEHILFCDREFEDFIEDLGAKNLLERSIVILSSDHGETFRHNSLMHGDTPYEPAFHIPLIIKEPGTSNGRVLDDIIEQVDIPATIIDFSGMPLPSWADGRSLRPLMTGGHLPERPAFSMYLQRSRSHEVTHGFISVYEGEYKLVHFIEEGRSLLYNLKEDPDELNDLFDEEPSTGQRLLSIVMEKISEANGKAGAQAPAPTGPAGLHKKQTASFPGG